MRARRPKKSEVEDRLKSFSANLDAKRDAALSASDAVDAAKAAYRRALAELKMAAQAAQERYSLALNAAAATHKIESVEDPSAATLNMKEAQRAASSTYNRELADLQRALEEAAEALWQAEAPARAAREAEAELGAQQELMVTIEKAERQEDYAKQMENALLRAAKMSAQRAKEQIVKNREEYNALMSLANTVAPDGKLVGGHSPVKPPLPRMKTTARSHVCTSLHLSPSRLSPYHARSHRARRASFTFPFTLVCFLLVARRR